MSGRGAVASRRRLATSARSFSFAALVAVLSGCASKPALLASYDDYAAYRATRVSRTLEGRLSAASAYLERHPRGAFAGEVRAYLTRAEPIYYAAKRRTVAGLTAYLATLPRGAFRDEATHRLRELVRERSAGDVLSRAAQETEAQLATQRADRARVGEEVTAWLRRFLDRGAWGRPLAEAPAEVIVPFSLALPPPRCAPADERARPGRSGLREADPALVRRDGRGRERAPSGGDRGRRPRGRGGPPDRGRDPRACALHAPRGGALGARGRPGRRDGPHRRHRPGRSSSRAAPSRRASRAIRRAAARRWRPSCSTSSAKAPASWRAPGSRRARTTS